jgi:hypothetical protein
MSWVVTFYIMENISYEQMDYDALNFCDKS